MPSLSRGPNSFFMAPCSDKSRCFLCCKRAPCNKSKLMCIFPLGARARFDLICPVVWHRAFAGKFLHRRGEAGPWQQRGSVTDGVQWVVFKYFAAMIKEILESDRCSCRKSARQTHASCLWGLGNMGSGEACPLPFGWNQQASQVSCGLQVYGWWTHPAPPVVTEDHLESLCVDTHMTHLHHFHTLHPRTCHSCSYRPRRKSDTVRVRLDSESIPI